ncbi:MAG TPA: hypothetical protein VIH27_01220 [Nitrososphaerales archaeon]
MTKHIHRYVRIKIGRNQRIEYKCSIPGCTHHVREELAIGRESLCYRCGNVFFLDKENMKLTRPRCINCKQSSNQTIIDKLAELVGKI